MIIPDKVCPACGSTVKHCSECNRRMVDTRPDAVTCSGACRIHRFRRLQSVAPAPETPKKRKPGASRTKWVKPRPEAVVEAWDPR